MFHFRTFANFPIRQAMSERRPEALSEGDIAFARDTIHDHIARNRDDFLKAAEFNPSDLTLGRQVHGDRVSVVGSDDRGRGQPPDFNAIPESDGLITHESDVALGTIVADCVPLLFYDPAHHALGVVHAGWRGTVSGIAANAVEALSEAFGTRATDIRVGIGPSIGPCCYEVGDEVIDAWQSAGVSDAGSAIVCRTPRPHFDLWRANILTLLSVGVEPDNIESSELCTRCTAGRFFSHRAAMAGERARGRMIMVAQLKG